MRRKMRILILLCFIGEISYSKQNLTQLHIFFRHGERTPTSFYKNDANANYSWPVGKGELTNNGKMQMYNLGLKLREQYNDFLTDYYTPERVKVLSSYSERCQNSAQVLLSALYPPKGGQVWNEDFLWQPIPIAYESRNIDKIIVAKTPCAKYDQIFKDLYKSEKIQKINEENKILYDLLTEQTGQNVSTLCQAEDIYNTLFIEELFGLPLPSWAKDKIYPEQLKYLAELCLSSFTETTYMKRIKAGPFLNKVLDNMKDLKTTNSVFLYSGHDLSIVNIFRALGVFDLFKPDFGAYFVIELWKLDNDFEVKILYSDSAWDTASEVKLPNCTTKTCSLSELEAVLEPVLPKDWDAECLQ